MHCANLHDSLFIENDGFIYPCFFTTSKLGPAAIKHNGQALHITDVDSKDMLLWDSHKEMREKMSNDVWPNPCSKCRLAEQKGIISHRQKAGESRDVKLKIIHIRLGNKCNLKCVMCGPNASNQWYDDYVHITGNTRFMTSDFTYDLIKKNDRFILDSNKFNFSDQDKIVDILGACGDTIQEINFHGGEPMLSKAHSKLIKNLVANKHADRIDLIYHTNATYADKSLLDIMSEFRSVKMILSLDGVGKVNEVIRYPSQWSDISQIIDIYKQRGFSLSVLHTLHFLNAEHLTYFADSMRSMDLSYTINPVIDPKYISISGLLEPRDLDYFAIDSYCKKHIKEAHSLGGNQDKISNNRLLFRRLWNKISTEQKCDMHNLFPIAHKMMESWL